MADNNDANADSANTSRELSQRQRTVGRYMLFGSIGAGGMGSVHIGRRLGSAGFSRLVAIKRLHPHLGKEKPFVLAFLDEARIAARITHPNVVSIDDVVMDGDEVLLVMEYVHGRSLSFLTVAERARGRAVPPPIATTLALDMLHGLQAAHDARDERGNLLGVIHRDVSPQNVLVGVDGIARILDFGIAKALGRLQRTETGAIKGKLAYMAPESLLDQEVTACVDVYAAGIVIWEMLAGERYFAAPSDAALISAVMASSYRHLKDPSLSAIDAVLERALERDPRARYPSCRELSDAIEVALDGASRNDVVLWVESVAGPELAESADAIAEIEQRSTPNPMPSSQASPSSSSLRTKSPKNNDDTELQQSLSDGAVVRVIEVRSASQPRSPIGWAPVILGAIASVVVIAIAAFVGMKMARSTSTSSSHPLAPSSSSSIVSDDEAPPAVAVTTEPAPSLPSQPMPSANAKQATAGRTPAHSVTTRPSATPTSSASSSTAKTPRPDEESPSDRK